MDENINLIVEELKSIAGESIKENLIQENEINNPFIQQLKICLIGCEILRDILLKYKTITEKKQLISIKFATQEIGSNEKQNLYRILSLGASLIFSLRKLITGEELVFIVGGATDDGRLKEAKYTQSELFNYNNLFKNIFIDLSDGYIELRRGLENVQLQQFKETRSLSSQWAKILKYGFIKNKNDVVFDLIATTQNGTGHKTYRKIKPDIDVYIRYQTKANSTERLKYYYYRNEEFYNTGWLYQWVKILWNEGNRNLIIDDSDTPLLPIFWADTSIRENKPGIQGGDYKLEQYKYQNTNIISIQNIYNILVGGNESIYKGLIPSIKNFIKNYNGKNQKELFTPLIQDFIGENNEQLKTMIQKRIKELMPKIK